MHHKKYNHYMVFLKYFILFIALFSVSTFANSEVDVSKLNPPAMNSTQYAGGAAVGTVLGFGLGHALQGRYAPWGVFYTASELALLSTSLASMAYLGATVSADLNYTLIKPSSDRRVNIYFDLAFTTLLVSSIGLLSIRLYEIFDLWAMPPIKQQLAEQAPKKPENALAFMPVLLPNYAGISVRF